MAIYPHIRRGLVLLVIGVLLGGIVPVQALANEWPHLEVISRDAAGNQTNKPTYNPEINEDGRYIVFSSEGAFTSDTTPATVRQIYLKDTQTGATELISKNNTGEAANDYTGTPDISDDGRFVTFFSTATNLSSEATGGLFLRDRQLGTTILVGAGSSIGSFKISGNGNYIAFVTFTNHVSNDTNYSSDVYVYDRQATTLELITQNAIGAAVGSSAGPTISDDGNRVAFRSQFNFLPSDTDIKNDVYVYDRTTHVMELASVSDSEVDSNDQVIGASISGDGQYVGFTSTSTNLGPSAAGGLFLRNLTNGTTTEIMTGAFSGTQLMGISDDGTYVTSSQIIPSDTGTQGVYVYNRTNGTLTLASINASGQPRQAYTPALSGDGQFLVFEAWASNLLPNDTNTTIDIGLASRQLPDTTAPTVSETAWTVNPLQQGQNTTLSAVAADESAAGVTAAEYSIDGGTKQPMTFDANTGTWTATFGAALAVSTYNVDVYATDAAGNISQPKTDVLAVYNNTTNYVSGHSKLTPTAADTLPIDLDNPKPGKKAAQIVLGFTKVSAPPSAGSFDLNYVVKNNQDEFNISSTVIDWVVAPDTTHANILGHGDMTTYVNGTQTVLQNVGVRIDIAPGSAAGSNSVLIRVYSPGVNPMTGSPSWIIEQDTDSSTLTIG